MWFHFYRTEFIGIRAIDDNGTFKECGVYRSCDEDEQGVYYGNQRYACNFFKDKLINKKCGFVSGGGIISQFIDKHFNEISIRYGGVEPKINKKLTFGTEYGKSITNMKDTEIVVDKPWDQPKGMVCY